MPDPLFPTGYEDFLRALGAVAGRDGWSQVRLVRMGDEAILRYHAGGQRQETVLDAAGIEEMLNQAFRQRGTGTPPSSTTPNIWVVPTSPNDERS
jgi:hypothetical protein